MKGTEDKTRLQPGFKKKKTYMDNHSQTSGHGGLYTMVSLIFYGLSWVSALSVHQFLQVASTIVSIGAGLMAIRHYYLQNKKIKK